MTTKPVNLEDSTNNQLIENLILDTEMVERTVYNFGRASSCKMRLAVDLMRIYRDLNLTQFDCIKFVDVDKTADSVLSKITFTLPSHKLTNKVALQLSEKLNYTVTENKQAKFTLLTKE